MGRKPIPIEPIQDERKRSVTFSKRKMGLFKKAMELAILCKSQILVICLDENQVLYECSSDKDPRSIVQKYVQTSPYNHELLAVEDVCSFVSPSDVGQYETLFGSRQAGKNRCRLGKKSAIPQRSTPLFAFVPSAISSSRIMIPGSQPPPGVVPPHVRSLPPTDHPRAVYARRESTLRPIVTGNPPRVQMPVAGDRQYVPQPPPTGYTPQVGDVSSMYSGYTPLPGASPPPAYPTAPVGPISQNALPPPPPALPAVPVPPAGGSTGIQDQPPPPKLHARNRGLKIDVSRREMPMAVAEDAPVVPSRGPLSPLTPIPDEQGSLFKKQ